MWRRRRRRRRRLQWRCIRSVSPRHWLFLSAFLLPFIRINPAPLPPSFLLKQADGGTRCAAINATTLALIDAGIPMSDFVVSCAAGYIDGTPLLDLNYVRPRWR